MIRNILKDNENIKPNDKEIAILKEHFPFCFKNDNSFDIERFKECLKDKMDVVHEGYELKFLGKSYAKLLASLDTTTVIKPDSEHNKKSENKNSENVYISGDNLDGLKHLLKSYNSAIKCIYIDPPYNTGTDEFVYKDNFNFTIEDLTEKLSVDEIQAERILNLTKRGSASDSAWLMFMYSRLLLAHDLLSKDGVIFISIDDCEQANLKLICDDIFGIENFIAQFPRITKRGGKSSDTIGLNHDYMLMYSKTNNPLLFPIEHDDKDFKYKDEFFEKRGYYKLNQTLDYDSLQYSPSLDYPIEIEGEIFYPGSSEEFYKERKSGIYNEADWAWRWSKEKFDFGYNNGFIVIKRSKKSTRIYTKTYQKATIEEDNGYYIDYSDRTKCLSTLETTNNIFSNDNATKDIAATIGKKIFDHTKPLSLIKLIAKLSTRNGDIFLDFFSGSATTAEAIMQLNSEDLENQIKFILIQIQEQCKENTTAYKKGYRTICDIGMNRIILAAKKIKERKPGTTVDLGFKHYILAQPSQNTLDKMESFIPDTLLADTTILDVFGKPTILTTWLIRDGYGFNAKVNEIELGGYTAYHCHRHLYFIDPDLKNKHVLALIDKYETNGSFNPNNIIVFGYSFEWSSAQALETNLRVLKDSEKNLKIEIDIRY